MRLGLNGEIELKKKKKIIVRVSTYMQYFEKGLSCCIRKSNGNIMTIATNKIYPRLITLAQRTDFTCQNDHVINESEDPI